MSKIHWDAFELLPNPLFAWFFILYYNLRVVQLEDVTVIISDYEF